jgi:hypothetical protein
MWSSSLAEAAHALPWPEFQRFHVTAVLVMGSQGAGAPSPGALARARRRRERAPHQGGGGTAGAPFYLPCQDSHPFIGQFLLQANLKSPLIHLDLSERRYLPRKREGSCLAECQPRLGYPVISSCLLARGLAGGRGGAGGGEGGEPFQNVHWVAVPQALRARRANRCSRDSTPPRAPSNAGVHASLAPRAAEPRSPWSHFMGAGGDNMGPQNVES